MLKIMRVVSMGLVATLLLIGHVQASGGGGSNMNNPYQDDGPLGNKQARKTVPDLIAEFDAPSKNLEQALYKVKYDGKYLTKDQRKKYYDALHNNRHFKPIVERIGYDLALSQVVSRSGTDATKDEIKVYAAYLYNIFFRP